MASFRVTVTGITPVMFDKFSGKEAVKRNQELPYDEQCQKKVYRMENDDKANLAIPGVWLQESLKESFIVHAGRGKKQEMDRQASSGIQIRELMIDLNQTDYEIDERQIPVKKNGSTVDRNIVYRPLLRNWIATFTLDINMPLSQTDIMAELKRAGEEIGMGAGRKIGFGRFQIEKFTKI